METAVASRFGNCTGGIGRQVGTAKGLPVLEDAPGSERVLEYEARMNYLVKEFDCTFLCIYDMSKLSGEMVVDIMSTHPYVVLNGEIRKNAFYVPPDIYLQQVLAKPR